MNIGIITQARMTSTRLPGKIFKKINNNPLIQYHIERLKQTGFEVVIATTVNKTDNIVCDYANANKLKFYRGDEQNVLSRFYSAAKENKLDIIVRVTSDCPLIDQHLIRNNVLKFVQFNNNWLYMSNTMKRTFARGFDFEIFSFLTLKDAYSNAVDKADLEHVTPYLWKNKSGKMELYNIKQEVDNSNFRITVDTTEDFELIKQLIEKFNANTLSYNQIEELLGNHPELVKLNESVEQKKV